MLLSLRHNITSYTRYTRAYFSHFVASLDQSTTSTKFSVFRADGTLLAKQLLQHKQYTPQQGYLEHNPIQIIQKVNQSIANVMHKLNSVPQFDIKKLKGIGICNQRQTVVCWDKNGNPLHNAIVWCDARTKEICKKFKQVYGEDTFRSLTGLPVSTYFTLFKIKWLLQNDPKIQKQAAQGNVNFGTIDSWIMYNLTGQFKTDASNASRTFLYDINQAKWDHKLLNVLNISQRQLPKVVDSFSVAGTIKQGPLKGIPVCSILGDQQSSAFAHNLKENQAKITYGTGCFLLNNIGTIPKINKSFATTILSKHLQTITYGYQVSIQCGGGTLNWAKRIGMLQQYQQLNTLKLSNKNLIFLPSFGSIFAPYWKDNVQGGFVGLSFNTQRQDLLYSLLQSITFRLYDNLQSEEFNKTEKLIVDGGMTNNPLFMKMNSTLFNKILQIRQLDTCWGVAKGVQRALNLQSPECKQKSVIIEPDLKSRQQRLDRYFNWVDKRNKIYRWE